MKCTLFFRNIQGSPGRIGPQEFFKTLLIASSQIPNYHSTIKMGVTEFMFEI